MALKYHVPRPGSTMPKPQRSTGSPPDSLSPLAARVVQLLDLLWAGKQRQMAADLGVSHAAISRIVRGKQAVGPRMLATIAGYRGVNAEWLRIGLGEPLIDPAMAASAGDWLAPVAKVILPGMPAEHSGLLTGERLAVANAYRRLTRYVLVVGPDDPIVRVEAAKVAAGDYLLMEADAATWLGNPMILAGRLVAVRLGGVYGTDYTLARADMEATTRTLKFDTFGVQGAPPQARSAATPDASETSDASSTPTRSEASVTGRFTTAPQKSRGIMPPRTWPSRASAKTGPIQSSLSTEAVPHDRDAGRLAPPSIGDVVAYCLLMIRT